VWNVIVASSNIVAIIPVHIAINRHDYLSAGCLVFVMAASIVSHLFASHKHGQVGFGCVPKISKLFDVCDVLGCVLLATRLLHLFVVSQNKSALICHLMPSLMFSLIVNIMSEWDKTAGSRHFFVLAHCVWHILIFYWIGRFFNELDNFVVL